MIFVFRCNSADQRISLGNVPIYLHGGQNFDHHLILKHFPADSKFPMTGVPVSSEKLKCLHYNKYRIIDSYQFLPSSLDKLSRSLVAEKKQKRERLNFLADSKLVKFAGKLDTELYNRYCDTAPNLLTIIYNHASV